jgi:trigger factor
MNDVIIDRFVEANTKTGGIEVTQDAIDEEALRMAREWSHRMKYESMASGSGGGIDGGGIDGGGGFISPLSMVTEDLMNEFRVQAAKQIKAERVLRQVIADERLEVTREELEQEAKALSEQQQVPLETVRDFFGEDMALLRDDLLVRKALDFIHMSTDTSEH